MPAFFRVSAQPEEDGQIPQASAFTATIPGVAVTPGKPRGHIYPFSYVPTKAGPLTITVQYRDAPLANSPFTATVTDLKRGLDTSLSTCKARGRALTRAVQNTPATFFIEARTPTGQLVRGLCSQDIQRQP